MVLNLSISGPLIAIECAAHYGDIQKVVVTFKRLHHDAHF